jgi:uncharacterized protein (DUF433 family)
MDKERLFSDPLYTKKEAALNLGLSMSTLDYWTKPKGNQPALVATVPSTHRFVPVIPFIGFGEATVISTFRRAVQLASLQYIRRALTSVSEELEVEHALASQLFYTDGVRILVKRLEEEDDGGPRYTEAVSRNYVMTEVLPVLENITYGADGWAREVVLPITRRPVLKANPDVALGQPIFIHGGARAEDVLGRFRAGDDWQAVIEDFHVRPDDFLDVVRAFLPKAA